VESLPISFHDVANTTSLINNGLIEAIDLIKVKPICKAQVENFDIVLTTWIHLVSDFSYVDNDSFQMYHLTGTSG